MLVTARMYWWLAALLMAMPAWVLAAECRPDDAIAHEKYIADEMNLQSYVAPPLVLELDRSGAFTLFGGKSLQRVEGGCWYRDGMTLLLVRGLTGTVDDLRRVDPSALEAAEAPATGMSVWVELVDESGVAVGDAVVSLHLSSGGVLESIRSEDNGYEFPSFPPGVVVDVIEVVFPTQPARPRRLPVSGPAMALYIVEFDPGATGYMESVPMMLDIKPEGVLQMSFPGDITFRPSP